jgi:AcrR family transcriptional regulator
MFTRFWFTRGMTSTPARAQGVRDRARAQMRTEILDAAREQLAAEGVGTLSLRGVARDMGMAPSALYRYFENRDVLLTALIVDAYDALGDAVERAERRVARDDLAGRWATIARGVRRWALANPSLYALVYGSPVPGYAAPQETVVPATRVTQRLAALVQDAMAARDAAAGPPALEAAAPVSPEATQGLAPLREFLGPGTTPQWAVHSLMAWTWLFGAVSFELFGQLNGAVLPEQREQVFDAEVERAAAWLGLGAGRP